ncbi:hypothetical protein LJC63_02850 [Ruminococcaceae bacterium OttesenSCG-928-L11]|nr:hypothetical protein [Ruminococcaceae bacterium OttesenSCG-928-L11]
MIKITFPHGTRLSGEQLARCERTLANLVTNLSGNFDITGLTEISVVENIATPHKGEFIAAGEVLTIYGDTIEYKMQVVGTIFDPRLIGNKQAFCEFTHMLHHELAHIHDHNKIVHIYKERELLKEELTQENVMWEFTLKIWSEFIATLLSSIQNARFRIEHNIAQLNQLYEEYCVTEENKNRFALAADMICYMAYLLGDILNHESLSEEISSKIDVGEFAPLFEQLFDELQSLLVTYPNWENIFELSKLKDIIQQIANMPYNKGGEHL